MTPAEGRVCPGPDENCAFSPSGTLELLGSWRMTSGLPPGTDIARYGRHVANVPEADISSHSANLQGHQQAFPPDEETGSEGAIHISVSGRMNEINLSISSEAPDTDVISHSIFGTSSCRNPTIETSSPNRVGSKLSPQGRACEPARESL